MRLLSQKRVNTAYVLMGTLGTVTGAFAMPVVTSTFADGVTPSGETTVQLNLQPVLGLWLSSTSQQGNTTPFGECSYNTMATNGQAEPVPLPSSGTATCDNTVTSSTRQTRNLSFSVLPGNTATVSMDARVLTNSVSGYKLFVEMTGNSTDLSDGSNNQFTASLGTIGSQLNDLVNGTWGVKGGDVTNWIGVPASGNGATAGLLKRGKVTATSPSTTYGPTTSSLAPSGDETTTITFGAHADYSMPSGTYTGTVVITAVTVD